MKKYLMALLGGHEEEEHQQDPRQDDQILALVQSAKEEWQAAQNYFEQVSDPELVDYAVYKIEAARRKYMYLLKQARISGVEERQVLHQINGANLS